jgi:hypothetical protein
MFFLSNVFLKVNGFYFEDVEYLHHYLTNKSRDIKPMMDQGYSVKVDVLLSISASLKCCTQSCMNAQII